MPVQSPGHCGEKTRVGGRRKTRVKAKEQVEKKREKEAPLAFSSLLTKQFSFWFFYWHMFIQHFRVNRVSWPWDGESTTTTDTEQLHCSLGRGRDKHNAYTAEININILYKHCDKGQVQCHQVCTLWMEFMKQPQLFKHLKVTGAGLRISGVFTEAAFNSNKRRKSEIRKRTNPESRKKNMRSCKED